MSIALYYRKPENMSRETWALLVRTENQIEKIPQFKRISFLPPPEIVDVGGKTTMFDATLMQSATEAQKIPLEMSVERVLAQLTAERSSTPWATVVTDGVPTPSIVDIVRERNARTISVEPLGASVAKALKKPKAPFKQTSPKNTGWKRKK